MVRRADPDYVVGSAPPYEVSPPIVHPAFCICAKCAALADGERGREHTFRLRRRSDFPNSRIQSAAFALQLKREVEEDLTLQLTATGRPGRMTLAEVFELYFLENPNKVGVEAITRDRLSARHLQRLITIFAADLTPDEIDEPVAVRYRNAREKEGAAPRSILNELSFLKKALAFGAAWRRDTGMDGTRFLSIPEVGEIQPRGVALTVDQFGAALEVVSPINRRRFIFGATSMLRRKPLLALQRSWVSVDERWLSVPAEWMKKGRAKRRQPLEVPLCDWAVAQVSDPSVSAEAYCWSNPATGAPLTWVDHIFADASRKIGVEFSCHDLRTTGASWLKAAKVDDLVIALLLGHRSSLDTSTGVIHPLSANVTRSYTKLFAATLREAVCVFDDIRRRIERPALRAVK